MSKIELIRIFSHTLPDSAPDLGIACLAAFLKKNNVGVKVTALELFNKGVALYEAPPGSGLVTENWDLPVILTLIRNRDNGNPLYRGVKEIIDKTLRGRAVTDSGLAENNLKKIYRRLKKNYNGPGCRGAAGFKVDSMNPVFVVMLSIILRQTEPGIKIILGGLPVTLNTGLSKILLKTGVADVIVTGEGEATLLEVLHKIEVDESPAVDGTITYDTDARRFRVLPQTAFLGLNELPYPDFTGQEGRSFGRLPVMASRGCVYSCAYCSFSCGLYKYRRMGYSSTVDMMQYLSRKYGVKDFHFDDNALNYSTSWLESFADELISRQTDFSWFTYFSPEAGISEALAQKLKKAGLARAVIGAQSFSDRTLELMGRRCSGAKTLKMVEIFATSGITVMIDVISGFPGEVEKSFQETQKTLKYLLEKHPGVKVKIFPFEIAVSSRCFRDHAKYGIRFYPFSPLSRIVPEVGGIAVCMPMYYKASGMGSVKKRYRMLKQYEHLTHMRSGKTGRPLYA